MRSEEDVKDEGLLQIKQKLIKGKKKFFSNIFEKKMKKKFSEFILKFYNQKEF